MEPEIDWIVRRMEAEEIPVMGIAPCGGTDTPRKLRLDLLPEARSVIVFGLPIPADVYGNAAHPVEMAWRAQNLLYKRLDALSLAVAQGLAERGARAVPVFGCAPWKLDRRGAVTGYANQLLLGELAGVGRIGRNGLLLHRRYGSRLMLGAVLTDADLPRARFPEEEHPDCPVGCTACADACPAGAISFSTRRVLVMRCLAYAARTPLMSKAFFAFLTLVNRAAAARYLNRRAFDDLTQHVCSRCVTECPYGGE